MGYPVPVPGAWYEGRDAMYAGMSPSDYWGMLEGEDPDDRAIREAHGIGYDAPDSTVCSSCGLTYDDISSGKIRACQDDVVSIIPVIAPNHLWYRQWLAYHRLDPRGYRYVSPGGLLGYRGEAIQILRGHQSRRFTCDGR